MSHSGSFGVDYKKTFTTANNLALPAQVGAIGSTPEGQWIFVQANGAIAQYAFVEITNDGQASEVTDALVRLRQIGVAQVAAANDEYLWVWVGGPMGGGLGKGIKGKILTGYVVGSALFTTTTAGALDDASGTDRISNVYGLATTTGTQAVELASTSYLLFN